MIPRMAYFLAIAALWGTCVVPQLCRMGALTACCAGGAHRQAAIEPPDACAADGCHGQCHGDDSEPEAPAERDCGSCAIFCGALVMASDSADSAFECQSPASVHSPALHAADFSDVYRAGGDLPRPDGNLPDLPRPPSDFPLLN
jgi:hypothetical protein